MKRERERERERENRGPDKVKTYTTLERRGKEGGECRSMTLAGRAMTYRPCSPRALTSWSRPESDQVRLGAREQHACDHAATGWPGGADWPTAGEPLIAIGRARVITHLHTQRARIGASHSQARRPERASLHRETLVGLRVPTRCSSLISTRARRARARTRSLRSFLFLLFYFTFWLGKQCLVLIFFFYLESQIVLIVSLRKYGYESGASFPTGLAPVETCKWQRIKYTAITSLAVARETRTSSFLQCTESFVVIL